MVNKLRIDGVYNAEIINRLKQAPIAAWNFDFRPRSFNFLQAYVFDELIKQHYSPDQRFFLNFENESELMVKKILTDTQNSLSRPLAQLQSNLWLEFSDYRPLDFYTKFQWPYLVHYYSNLSLASLRQDPFCKGLVFSYSLLKSLHGQNNFHTLVKDLLPQLSGLELVLQIDWEADFFPGLFDFIEFKFFAVAVNRQVEQSYRQVDFPLLTQKLKVLTGQHSSLLTGLAG